MVNKILAIIVLISGWAKMILYDPAIATITNEWKEKESIPPRFSKETKKLIRKQNLWITAILLLSLIPFGPLSLLITSVLIYVDKNTIREHLKLQDEVVENYKEELRQKKKNFLEELSKKVNADNDIDWTEMILPGSEEDKLLQEFLYGENGVLTKEPLKNKKENHDKEKT